MRIPPGVSAARYANALRQFEQVVGKENVYRSDEDLDLYRDSYSVYWGEPEERIAAGAVAPASVAEVQAIVRIANQYRIPLYPFSTGRNLGYGGSAPAYSGSVVLDLKRMNRVLEINEPLHYALVEPGVSFFDLYREIRARGLRLYPSVPAPGWGSPIGNSLDHGCGSPARDRFRNHCGMEVVLPNGELLRTGMGALPNAATWQTYHYGFGPHLDGLFSQSNYGIVTKMGVNLFREPELTRSIVVASRNYDDLEALVATAEYAETEGILPQGGNCFSPLMAGREPEVMALIQSAGGGSARDWNRLATDRNRDLYAMNLQFRGAARVVDAQVEEARARFGAIAGIRISDGKSFRAPLDVEQIDEPDRNNFGIPTLWRFYPDLAERKDPDWSGHLWFSPNIPQTGEALRRANRVFQQECQKFGLYWGWSGGICFFPKNYTLLFAFEAGNQSPEANRRNREAYLRLVQIGTDNGWSEYRTAPAFMDAIMNTFSYGDHALRRFCETLKDAIDPNGILSAGRYGIWPRHLRRSRT